MRIFKVRLNMDYESNVLRSPWILEAMNFEPELSNPAEGKTINRNRVQNK
jgi:hypothetical protein